MRSQVLSCQLSAVSRQMKGIITKTRKYESAKGKGKSRSLGCARDNRRCARDDRRGARDEAPTTGLDMG